MLIFDLQRFSEYSIEELEKLRWKNNLSVGLSHYHSSFLDTDGNVYVCGYNNYGQLGIGNTTNQTSFIKVSTEVKIKDIDASGTDYSTNTFFLTENGDVYATGRNNYGQFGLNNTTQYTSPTKLVLTDIVSIASSEYHALFLKADGTVYSCGYNGYGQLGLGNTTQYTTPQLIPDLEDVILIAAGGEADCIHSAFLKADGTVYTCGYNGYGALGTGDTETKNVPTKISITDVVDIKINNDNANYTLFLKSDRTAWACGWNGNGGLGIGHTVNVPHPTQVLLDDVIAIAACDRHSLFIKGDGTVWTCGYNGYGQLGLGNTTQYTTPQQITAIKDIIGIAGSGDDGVAYSIFIKGKREEFYV